MQSLTSVWVLACVQIVLWVQKERIISRCSVPFRCVSLLLAKWVQTCLTSKLNVWRHLLLVYFYICINRRCQSSYFVRQGGSWRTLKRLFSKCLSVIMTSLTDHSYPMLCQRDNGYLGFCEATRELQHDSISAEIAVSNCHSFHLIGDPHIIYSVR